MTLEFSYQIADSIMCKRATSFYSAFQEMQPDDFRDIAAIYAFCRYADDLSDNSTPENTSHTAKMLDELEQDVLSLYQENSSSRLHSKYDWWMAFEHTVICRQIPAEPFLLQIEGQRHDVFFRPIKTVDDLIDYSKKVAGSVGLMLAPMLRGEKATEDFESLCESLGIAMQITNILRDIGEDIRERNRIYLPTTLRKHYRVSKSTLRQLSSVPPAWKRFLPFFRKKVIPSRLILLWEELATLSEAYYQPIYQNLYMFRKEAILPVTAAAVFYQAILDEVRKNRYDCFSQRCYTNAATRAFLLHKVKEKIHGYAPTTKANKEIS